MIRNPTWYWDEEWNNFRKGNLMCTLEWEQGSAKALLYDQGVSNTVNGIVKALPLEIPLVHVAWSGEMIMSTKKYDIGVHHQENNVRLVQPGDLTWDPKYGELGFVYGPAECRLPSGPNTVVVYGKVIDNVEEFVNFCRMRRFEGVGSITMKLT